MLVPSGAGLLTATNHWSVSMGSTTCPVRAQRGTCQPVLLGLDQQALGFEVGHDLLARDEAVQPAVGSGRVVVHLRVERPARRSSAGRGAGPPA
jgi:hypothetical protein